MAEQRCEQKYISRIGLAMFVYIALTVALQRGAAALLPLVWPGTSIDSWTRYALLLLPQYVVAMPAAYLVLKRLPQQTITKKCLGAGRFFVVLLICYFILYAGSLAAAIITQVISAIAHKQMADLTAEMLTGSGLIANLIVVGILAPVMEELFYRRLIIGKLARYGERTAVIVSGLVFGLVHGNLSQFFYAFGLGAALGFVYIRTGRLRYTIALHIFINMVGSVIAPLVLANQLAPLYGAAVISMAIAGLVLLINNRRRITFKPGVCELQSWKRSVFLSAGMLLFFGACAALFVFNTAAALN